MGHFKKEIEYLRKTLCLSNSLCGVLDMSPSILKGQLTTVVIWKEKKLVSTFFAICSRRN